MSSFSGVTDVFARKSKIGDVPEGCYLGEDGLLYCAKCRTPIQLRQEVLWQFPPEKEDEEYENWVNAGSPIPRKKMCIFPVMCKCRTDARKVEMERAKKLEDMRKVRDLRISSLIDEKFKDSTFEAFRTTKYNARALKLCKRYAENFDEMRSKNQGLLLYGNVGTGKTYMAACIANYLMQSLVPVVMTSFVKILQDFQKMQNSQKIRSDDEEEQFIKKLDRAKLLIIDDLGAERSTDYGLEKVYNVIDSRYRARLPMLLTTNLSLPEMQETMDIRYARIYDRVFEVCYPIQFTGQSWRKVEAAKRFDDMSKFLEGDA